MCVCVCVFIVTLVIGGGVARGVVTPPTYLIGSLIQDWVEVVVGGVDHNGDLNT